MNMSMFSRFTAGLRKVYRAVKKPVEKPVETVQQTVKPVEVIKEVPITTQVRTCSFLSIAHLLTLSPPDHSFLGVFLHPPFSFAYSCWS